jgi:hypothetical protein
MKDHYKIDDRDSGFPLTTDTFKNLEEVQAELNTIKKMVENGETLFSNLEQFMETKFIVYNNKRYFYFIGNKKIWEGTWLN